MIGNILKMQTVLGEQGTGQVVQYSLPMGGDLLPLNEHIGEKISLRYKNEIHCVACGRKTSKSFAQGHCYPCFRSLASCDMCIMKPETCHYAEGTCRQPEWGESNCFIPHYVYLANSSGIKVGITRGTQIPTRWMDQGATQALPVFRVATRLQSGLLEVALKQHVSDRTDWRKMLKGEAEFQDLGSIRDELFDRCSGEIDDIKKEQGADAIQVIDEEVTHIKYPVSAYPDKIKSLNFDKQADIEGCLMGIKGQYLILDTGVLNIRKFSGYNIEVDFV
ncbi:MAG TPA: DUF2797 domain-containing protein [Gammaproteobacteria bacterium]|nr:DUF2797 domain-containing protein [Gammaproteobacteria bacterium]